MRPDGTKYGNFNYPERDGKNKQSRLPIDECLKRINKWDNIKTEPSLSNSIK